MTRPTAIGFVRFCAEVLRVQLTPGQRVLTSVAFDGVEPGELQGFDRELARAIFGDVDTIPPAARHVLCAVCGARGGKSYVLGALRLLHLALTVDLSTLAPGEVAAGVIVAPDLRLARQTLRYVAGAAQGTSSIARLVEAETADSLTLRRPDGRAVTIECLPATRGGGALRGRTLVGAVLDESAFFRDADFVINDAELYKAVAPRIVPDGQVIIASTPWSQAGLLFELFSRNHGHPVDAIAAHAPTLLLRDDDHTRQLVDRERERDPDNAAREFDAEFMSGAAAEFFDPAHIAAALERGADMLPVSFRGRSNVVLGLDTAFRRDATAGVVMGRVPGSHAQVVLDIIEIRPPKGGRLVPSETLKQILARAEALGASEVIADGHYVETLREHCRGMSLIEAPGGQPGKVEVYTRARKMLGEGLLAIPTQHARLAAQMRQVVGRPQPGGGLTISSPRRAGSHGDVCSGYVLASWRLARLWQPTTVRAPDPYAGRHRTGPLQGEHRATRYHRFASGRRRRVTIFD